VFGDTYTPRVVLMDSKLRPGDLTPPSPRKWILDLRAGDRVAAKLPKDCRGDHVRLRVRLKRREFDSWELIRDALRNEVQALGLELYGIEFLAAEEPKSISSGGKVATGRAISESPEELIHRYAKQQDVPEETLKAGMECLE